MSDVVVLLHGLGRSPLSMLPLKLHLAANGFTVRNFGYPSRRGAIDDHAARLKAFIKAHIPSSVRIHFVGHSLGGIVVRAFADRYGSDFQLGRLVMLGSPNRGAQLADALRTQFRWSERVMGPSFSELAARSTSAAPHHSSPLEIGIIAGVCPLPHPLFSEPNDGIVSVWETRLEGAAEPLAMPGLHALLMCQPAIMRETAHFLRCGRFKAPQVS